MLICQNSNYTSHSAVEMYGILTVDYRAQFMQAFSLLLIKSTITCAITRLFLR